MELGALKRKKRKLENKLLASRRLRLIRAFAFSLMGKAWLNWQDRKRVIGEEGGARGGGGN